MTALLAQGLEEFEAAALAAFVHGLAADRVAARTGDSGLSAADLARELPATTAALRAEAEAASGSLAPRARLAVDFPEP